MPGVLAHPFAHSPDASLEELGTTFAAEITGLNLSNGLSGPAFEEVRDAVTKVAYNIEITGRPLSH